MTTNFIIPINPVANQTLQVQLNGQRCRINVYEKKTYHSARPPSASVLQTEVLLETIQTEQGDDLYVYEIGGATESGPALYLDLIVNDALVIGGVICLDAVPIVRSAYLGFIGDLVFIDTQGSDDPTFAGLGSRWFLCYMMP